MISIWVYFWEITVCMKPGGVDEHVRVRLQSYKEKNGGMKCRSIYLDDLPIHENKAVAIIVPCSVD